MDVSRAVTEVWKIWICGGAVGLIFVWGWLSVRNRRIGLGILVVLSLLNYARWGFESVTSRVDAYDLMHYYVNSKYFDEIGYYDLYPCLILADHENDGPRWDEGNWYMAQHVGGHVFNPIPHALARGRHVRQQQFSPERWAAFEHDVLYLGRDRWRGKDALWQQLIIDHGYNGTPGWTLVGGAIANVVPVEMAKVLCLADVGLLGLALVAVGWAFGFDAAAWVALFLLVSYSTRWPTITWAYLRYDYVAALLMATAMLRKGHPAVAGALTGWAAAFRLFPVLWLWGPLAKLLSQLSNRSPKRGLLVFFAAFTIVTGGLVGGAAARYGPEQVGIHLENMRDHNSAQQLSSRRIGLALALNFDGGLMPKLLSPQRRDSIVDQKPLRYLLAGLILVGMGWGLRRRRNDEAFALGFLPLFLLTTASYYYYVVRATLIVLHAGDLDVRNRIALAWLFGLELFSNAAETMYPGYRMFLIGYLSWGLALYAVAMTALIMFERWDSEGWEPQEE